jgi:hypothetical protein
MFGWVFDPDLPATRPDSVGVAVHHRTGFHADLCHRTVDDEGRWSDAWWLDDGDTLTALCGEVPRLSRSQ